MMERLRRGLFFVRLLIIIAVLLALVGVAYYVLLYQARTKATSNASQITASIDAKGFIIINGQKTLPGLRGNIGGALSGVGKGLVNRRENGSNLDEVFNTDPTRAMIVEGYGEAMQSFTCKKSPDLDQSDGINDAPGRCAPCTKLNNLCPDCTRDANGVCTGVDKTCNYCNPDFYSDRKTPAEAGGQRDLLEQIMAYPNYIGNYFDEPGGWHDDPRLLELPLRIKEAFPTAIIVTADNLQCIAKKQNGTWVLQTQLAGTKKCASQWKMFVGRTLDFFSSPSVDVIGAESGYWPKLIEGHTTSTAYTPPKEDDIQQLIAGIEYFRQEVKARTGKKKPVMALMQLQNIFFQDHVNLISYRPNYDEVRSMVYASLGHQARAVSHYDGGETYKRASDGVIVTDPEYARVHADLDRVKNELESEGVLNDYLDPTRKGNNGKVSSNRDDLDVTAFYTTKSSGAISNYYIIVTSLNGDAKIDNASITMPKLSKNITAKIIGTTNTRSFTKGRTAFNINLNPHQTKVFRFSYSSAEINALTNGVDD